MSDTIYTTKEIKEKIAIVLKNTKVKKAILFGSYAKGRATSNSDIDILIDSNNEIVGLEFYGIWEEISKTGVVIYEKGYFNFRFNN